MKLAGNKGDAEKGGTPGDGVQGKDTTPVPAHREPDGAQIEILENDAGLQNDGDAESEGTVEPAPTWGKSLDYSTGRLHDVLCAAYGADVITATYPTLKTIADAVDQSVWAERAQHAMGAGDLDTAHKALALATAARTIATADPEAVEDARAGLHKSFTDMYPDTHPTPSDVTPGRFRRPYISVGHAPLSAATPGSQRPAPGHHDIAVGDFNRGPLTAGHAAQSPAAKTDGPVHAAALSGMTGEAMKSLHDHIAAAYPHVCPMSDAPAPEAVGTGGSSVVEPATKAADVTEPVTKTEAPAGPPAVTVSTVEQMLAKALATRDATIAELTAQVEELGAQPEPNLAPYRGVIATKSTSGGAGVAERRSLVDEAKPAPAPPQSAP
jgi:hypothetical protein